MRVHVGTQISTETTTEVLSKVWQPCGRKIEKGGQINRTFVPYHDDLYQGVLLYLVFTATVKICSWSGNVVITAAVTFAGTYGTYFHERKKILCFAGTLFS